MLPPVPPPLTPRSRGPAGRLRLTTAEAEQEAAPDDAAQAHRQDRRTKTEHEALQARIGRAGPAGRKSEEEPLPARATGHPKIPPAGWTRWHSPDHIEDRAGLTSTARLCRPVCLAVKNPDEEARGP